MFFKSNKEKQTKDLCLSDYQNIWTKFCFLDETGSLNSGNEKFFTVGILKMSQPYYLQSKIIYNRNKVNFHDEIKFNSLSRNKVEFVKFIIDAIFETSSLNFYSYTINKESDYFQRNFSANPWIAYEKVTLKLLDAALAESEILILIADHITVPKNVKFETEVKKNFNASKSRLALAGVSRFNSKSNDLLQVVDLIVGIISYDLKVSKGIIPGSDVKTEIVNYFKQNLGATDFSTGFKNRNFNIFVDKSGV